MVRVSGGAFDEIRDVHEAMSISGDRGDGVDEPVAVACPATSRLKDVNPTLARWDSTTSTDRFSMMRSTLTSISYGLVVDIGGVVPSTEVDKRLGDVVVCDGKGVIQYDMDKEEYDLTATGGEHVRWIHRSDPRPPGVALLYASKVLLSHASTRPPWVHPVLYSAVWPRQVIYSPTDW